MKLNLKEIADKLDLELVGDDLEISGINTLDEAREDQLSFLVNPKFANLLETTKAACILTDAENAEKCDCALISENVYMDLARIVNMFEIPQGCLDETSELAYIHPEAQIADDVIVYPFAFVGRGAKIGSGTKIFTGCYVGEDAVIGEDCILYPQSVVMGRVSIGHNVILQPGAVVGGDGYGYAQTPMGHMKIPQIGTVEIADNVEVGSNAAIDRAALDVTSVGRGTKIDNLVQVAHNVRIGENCLIISQVGVAGSCKIGDNVVIAGQAGLRDNITIGDNAMIAAKSGLSGDVKPGAKVMGAPAIDAITYQKAAGYCFPKLPKLFKRVRQLEKKLKELEAESE